MSRNTKKGWLSGISIPLYLLVIVFNLASWIDLNALWTEMPLLVNRLPEGWELPAYFNLIINGGKIALVVYVILKKLMKDNLQEHPFVYAIIVIGASCLFVTAFVWDRTAIIGGKEVSLTIMILTFLLSVTDCLSGVIFLPYLSRFGAQYITAFLVGEGICQLVPAIAGIMQGIGENPDCQQHSIVTYDEATMMNNTSYEILPKYYDPKFSVQGFFIMMSGIMALSGIAFQITFIHYLPRYKRKQLSNQDKNDLDIDEVKKTNKLDTGCNSSGTADVQDSVTANAPASSDSDDNPGVCMDDIPKDLTKVEKGISGGNFIFCLVLMSWGLGIIFGFMPGIQSYSALPYGNRAYNLSLRLGLAANSIMNFLALFVYTKSKARISCLYMLGTAATIYQIVLASYSPYPPLKGDVEGEVLMVSILRKSFRKQ